ncbi:MAG: type IX secretion system protein PorQ [Bacteroidales bacterium]
MKKSILLPIFLIIAHSVVMGQKSSQHAFQFLNLAASPRVAAIGGSFLPLADNDLMLALHNPALINADMHNHLGLTFLDHYAGISAGNVVYGRNFEKYGSFLGGIRFMHYGNFQRTDPTGMDQGSFTASDLALTLGWGRALYPGLRLGADLNIILSNYDVWSSFALAADVSGHYTNQSGLFQASLLVRNAGRQIDRYAVEREDLPFDIAAGISQKLKHAPIRFFVLLNTLHHWDLTYEDPLNPSFTTDPITGEIQQPGEVVSFLDKAMRHVIVGMELMPGEMFRLRLGYDYRTRQEAGVRTKMGNVGFSWGLGLKLGKYQFDFSRTRNHIAGAPNYFSIRTDLSAFGK